MRTPEYVKPDKLAMIFYHDVIGPYVTVRRMCTIYMN